jgi:hypothetical protein
MGNAETIQEFLVKLGFNVDEKSLSNFMGGLDSAAIRIAGFGAAMTAVAVAVVHSVQEIASENVQLDLLAKQLNTTAGAVDDFVDTADIMGISNETATTSLKNFADNVADASMGIGRAKIVFEKLGISVKDAGGNMRSATDVMEDLKVKMAGLGRAQQLRIMEKLGLDPKLLVMFNDAFGDTAKITTQLSAIDAATGFDLTKAIKQSKEFNSSWHGMQTEVNLTKMLFSKIHETIAVRMMPGIQKGVEEVTRAIENARHFIMDNAKQIEDALQPILETVVSIGAAVARLTGRAFQLMGELIKPVVDIIISANKETHGWLFKIMALTVAWKAFNLSFLISPLGLILALGAALLLLYDDWKTWKEGGKSAIDWGSKTGKVIQDVVVGLGLLAGAITITKGLFMAWAVVSKIAAAAQMALNVVMSANPIGLLIVAITALVFAGYELVKHWDVVKKWFSAFFNWIKKAWSNILDYSAIGLLIKAGETLIKNWDVVKKWFNDFFDGFVEKWNIVSNAASKLSSMFGDAVNIVKGDFSGEVTHKITAQPLGADATAHHVTVHQDTTMHINGAQSPQATAQAVVTQQNHVNAQVVRNMTARVR